MKLQLEAVVMLRKIVSVEVSPPIDGPVRAGLVPRLVDIMKARSDPNLILESAWILTNIASGASELTQAVINSGSIPIFVSMISEDDRNIRKQAIWAIYNIAGDSPVSRDLILHSGVTGPLLSIAKCAESELLPMKCSNLGLVTSCMPPISLLSICAECISNLCRGTAPRPLFKDIEPFIPALVNMIKMSDDSVVSYAAWSLSYITDDDSFRNFRIEAVVRAGAVEPLVKLLNHSAYEVLLPVLRTVGNIFTGEDHQTQVVIDSGALDAFGGLLRHSNNWIRQETAWTIYSITLGASSQIQAVLNTGLLSELIKRLEIDEADVKKECAWAVSNMVSRGTPAQIRRVVASGAVIHLLRVLSSGDEAVMIAILQAFKRILRRDKSLTSKLASDEVVVVTTAASEDQISGEEVRRLLREASLHSSPEVSRLAIQILREFL